MSDVRLIDANGLEKTAIPCEIHNGASTELCVPLYQIRNAPTLPNPCSNPCNFTIPTGEWIPVSERVPEIATRCIVQLSNGYITIGEYFSIGKWTLIETSLQFVYPKETVTAWMPLPQPYKEEDEA